MAEKPIIFNTEMVRAILDDRKTQTRRVVKPQPPEGMAIDRCHYSSTGWAFNFDGGCTCEPVKPPYKPGDILWVRETWVQFNRDKFNDCLSYQSGGLWRLYKADGELWHHDLGKFVNTGTKMATDYFPNGEPIKWRSSIHMPCEVARIFLEVTDVRVERLHDITEEDAQDEGSEGIETSWLPTHIANFAKLWDSLNAKRGYGWEQNPWVFVISFKKLEGGGE